MAKTIYMDVPLIEYSLEEWDEHDKLHEDRVIAFSRLKDYLLSGVYTSYRHKDEFLSVMLSEHIPLGKITEVIANRLGISENTVRISRFRMSEEAYSKVGRDVFNIILHGNAEELERLHKDFDILECGVSSEWFPFECSRIVKEMSHSVQQDYDLSECSAELDILYLYSLPRFHNLLDYETINANKMKYLLQILEDSKTQMYSDVMRLIFADRNNT